MRRAQAENLETAGQDSFVDVVTNLVGIMIVLVIIVGVRVKHVWVDPNSAKALPADVKAAVAGSFKDADAATVLAGLKATAGAIEADVHKVDDQVAAVEQEFAVRSVEREQLATLVSAGEHELATRRGKLQAGDQADFDLHREAAALEQQLGEGRQQLERVANEKPPAVELRHQMTPISRTVFGKEVHFRLAKGHISYVPLQELLDEAKESIRKELMDRTSPVAIAEHEHTAGPYAGFEMQFTMGIEPNKIQFKQMQIVPVAGEPGETVADALRPTSEFRRRLADHDPSQTTVTIWVYPENFTEFRAIKEELTRLGFATAARPLPPGINISGSDKGSHSAAQ